VAEVADGVIVGSALVRLLGDGAGRPAASLPAEVERFVADLVAAVRA
jgi:tryptophan synthase alpha subunit